MNPFFTLADMYPFMGDLFYEYMWVLPVLSMWALAWKGLALWRAAKLQKPGWFVALLIVNTFGIFEIIYLLATNKQGKDFTTTYE